jgi:pteridine reductase
MKSALITGGSKRIGKAVALKLATLGYDIALHYNDSHEDALAAKQEIERLNVRCGLFRKDFSAAGGIKEFFEDVLDGSGGLNLLVNSASVFIRSPISDTDTDLFDLTMNVNFKVPFFLIKEFGKRCRPGNIINILDTKITENNPNYAVYNISRKALFDLTLESAKEFAPDIRVNAIAPGLILPPDGKDENYLDGLAKNVPLKRKGSVDNITDAVGFLLTDDYITGQVIFINGGQNL